MMDRRIKVEIAEQTHEPFSFCKPSKKVISLGGEDDAMWIETWQHGSQALQTKPLYMPGILSVV